MADNSTPTKNEFSSNEKTSNNTSFNLNNLNQENDQENILNSNESYQNKNRKKYTFKINKRRVWDKKEDETIIELVHKYGTTNWAIIANEMANKYKSNQRNGKQCRERWYNILNPIVNKDDWTEEEESILFKKHLEYGNKWTDISKYLPGRSENSIKNHFYSKLRKFIRKILRQIEKENLLKNSGIDLCKYSGLKVYKLLKKNKISYKNITKDTILDMILRIENKQKDIIFAANNENKLTKNFSTNNNYTLKNALFNADNDKGKSNNSLVYNNIGNKNFDNKNLKAKSTSSLRNDNAVYEVKEIEIKNEEIFDINITNILNQAKNEKNTQNISKNKGVIENVNRNNKSTRDKNRLTINFGYVDETYKFKTKSKSKIEVNNINYNKKILNKKRRRKAAISLSTHKNKKVQINRNMSRRRYIFGFGQKLSTRSKNYENNNLEIFIENFDPLINNVEIVRDGLEIHSKSIILINKSLLTEELFPEMNYDHKPNLNTSIPTLSPKAHQIHYNQIIKSEEENDYVHNFNEKNISIGLSSSIDGYYEQQITPKAYNMIYPPSNKQIYNANLSYENNLLRKNFSNRPGFNSSMIPNTPKKGINLEKKIVIQSNINSINEIEKNDDTNIEEKSKKPPALNIDFIDNYNENIESITSPLFSGNEEIDKQFINSPENLFNLSPTCPFIPRNFGEK